MLQRKPLFYTVLFLVVCTTTAAQTVSQKLAAAFRQFEQDPQLKHALASLYVTDGSGTVVFEKNAAIGLAPASTQKIITSATAYALLGAGFQYKTTFGFLLSNDGANSLSIRGSGDPTLGSWRWKHTRDTAVLNRIARAARGVTLNATVVVDTSSWDYESLPGGWVWEDIGNYYGAGVGVLNWHENQYDAFLRSGAAVGDPVEIISTDPVLKNHTLTSKAVAAAKGSGDNAYIYFPLAGNTSVVRGTIPVNEKRFVISGALPEPARQFAVTLLQQLQVEQTAQNPIPILYSGSHSARTFHTEVSPPLDSIIYWFNKKSINLYGEALLKTIAFQQRGVGSTEAGMAVLKSFWKGNGISEAALNLVDGSGLSPLNRVTTQAQVAVLRHAKKQVWFPGFYHSLPEYNGMKLKSGTIRGVKGFAGYYKSRTGTEYVLSFLVNNYTGSASALVAKMYAVLNVLK